MKNKPAYKAFCYARVSVDEEDGNNASISSQRDAIIAYAEREGIEIVGFFEDVGVSGTKLQRREFDRMIAEATGPDRPVHYIIVSALSRFARRLLTQVMAEHKLASAGVQLVSLTETFGNDANGKMMRNMVAIINEKYAYDASVFTRRDRRTNARNGYYNGGQVPFGYESRTVHVDGTKERKKLVIVEEEAEVVRLIYRLARVGLAGQPMGTRSIAAWLNTHGYTLRGRPFFHSALDGILTRPHYLGAYPDKTADDDGRPPEVEDWIWVECPRIIEPEEASEVAALRAKAAPAKTPPRVTNGPTLLTGLAVCGMADCGKGLTIRTGKSGQYAYYGCSAKANAGAQRCGCKSIPQEKLDSLVLDEVVARILEPERLRELLSGVLEVSNEADARRKKELEQARAQRNQCQAAINRLLELVETGMMSPKDPELAKRMALQRSRVAALDTTIDSLERQLARGATRITPEVVDRFGDTLKQALLEGEPPFRKAYVRMLVQQVALTNDEIRITGSKLALEHALARSSTGKAPVVPSFDREWCPGEDSNLHALASAST